MAVIQISIELPPVESSGGDDYDYPQLQRDLDEAVGGDDYGDYYDDGYVDDHLTYG